LDILVYQGNGEAVEFIANVAILISGVYAYPEENLKIYPNPASDFITIEVPKDDFVSLCFYNGIGQQFPATATRTGNALSAPSLPYPREFTSRSQNLPGFLPQKL